MKFDLDGLEVCFPYDRVYLEQYRYMKSLKAALESGPGGHCLLEMPTGTGKTVSLLSLITSWKHANPSAGKLVYCTRTVPEMNAVMAELGTVLAHRAREYGGNGNGNGTNGTTTNGRKRPRPGPSNGRMGPIRTPGGAGGSGLLALCLSSRRNMCIHEGVLAEADREAVDARCRSMTASWVVERNKEQKQRQQQQQQQQQHSLMETCQYFDNFSEAGDATVLPSGVYDLDQLRIYGRKVGWCPYFMTRRAIHHADVLVFNYQYMLDPKVAKMVSTELEAESIIVFDEAHNIDSVCIEALSVVLTDKVVDQASRSLGILSKEVARIKSVDADRLRNEYDRLLNGLIDRGLLDAPANDGSLASNVLSPDVLHQAVPGNIRRAEHFIGFMKKIVEYLKSKLRRRTDRALTATTTGSVQSETPLSFLHRMVNNTSLEAKPLRFAYSRLNSLLRTLQVSNLDEFGGLSDVADFATLLATYSEGVARFAVITELSQSSGSSGSGVSQLPRIQLACLDASLAIAPLFQRFGTVVITSGTLSPIDLYPKLLRFRPRVSESFSMSTFRPCILPLVVARGSDQLPMSTRFDDRADTGIVRNYGAMLVELCRIVPDGVVAFFTSYAYMESIVAEWDGMGVLRRLTHHKLVFVETKDVVETTLALDNYRRACDCGRGAVFLSVARGKVSEGINFDRHYGRAVVMFGVPYQYTLSHVLRARLEYLRAHHQIREGDFLNFDALRQTAQCVGRIIRSKTDYGLMVLADTRYTRHDKRSKLPRWILQFLHEHCLDLSTDTAVNHATQFLRKMAQPIDQAALKNVLLSIDEIRKLNLANHYDVSLKDKEEEKEGDNQNHNHSTSTGTNSEHTNDKSTKNDMDMDRDNTPNGDNNDMLVKSNPAVPM